MRISPIASTVLTSTSNSVTISSIPSSYTDLYILLWLKHNGTGSALSNLHIRMNGATTGYYDSRNNRYMDGTTTGSGSNAETLATTRIGVRDALTGAQFDSGSNPWSIFRIYIPSYSTTDRFKTINVRGGGGYLSTGYSKLGWGAGLLASTAAVTSINFEPESTGSQSFIVGSRFDIYGIA